MAITKANEDKRSALRAKYNRARSKQSKQSAYSALMAHEQHLIEVGQNG